jgi:hypothetical protein
LKLSKLFLGEVAIVLVVLIVIVVFVEGNSSLATSTQSAPIGAYNQKTYAQDIITIAKGEAYSSVFDYSSYEPAILKIDLTVTGTVSAGYLDLTCNGRYVGSVYVSADTHHALISAISITGAEWVKPPSAYSNAFSNEVAFASNAEDGFEGTFSFQINLKGSR